MPFDVDTVGIMAVELNQIEAWARERSDDPNDFERRSWPDGVEEIVYLPTNEALRKEPPKLTEPEMDGAIVMQFGWLPCVPREVKDDAGT